MCQRYQWAMCSVTGEHLEFVEREVSQPGVQLGEVAGLDGVQCLGGGAEGQGLEVVVLRHLVLLQAVVHGRQAVVGRPLVHAHACGGRGAAKKGHDWKLSSKAVLIYYSR